MSVAGSMRAEGATPRTIADLTAALRLRYDDQTRVLLNHPEVKESFRLYSNRCLSPNHLKPEMLPDWNDVDTYLHSTSLSDNFRHQLHERTETQPLTQSTRQEIEHQTQLLLESYVERIAFDKPYELLEHVALFVLRLSRFLSSEHGRRFFVLAPRDDVLAPEVAGLEHVTKGLNMSKGKVRELEMRRRCLAILKGLLSGLGS